MRTRSAGRSSPITGHRLHQLLGLQPDQLLQSPRGVLRGADEGSHVREFRDMVKALHRAGIEVILDVVFNHTGEGNHEDPRSASGASTTASTTTSSRVRQAVLHEPLRVREHVQLQRPTRRGSHRRVPALWVREMHVDGFRFDLASILSRGPDGQPMSDSSPCSGTSSSTTTSLTPRSSPRLGTRAVYYQVGYFPGFRWAEWNGRFRDDVRRFVKGDAGMVSKVSRISRQRRRLPGRRRAADRRRRLHHRP